MHGSTDSRHGYSRVAKGCTQGAIGGAHGCLCVQGPGCQIALPLLEINRILRIRVGIRRILRFSNIIYLAFNSANQRNQALLYDPSAISEILGGCHVAEFVGLYRVLYRSQIVKNPDSGYPDLSDVR